MSFSSPLAEITILVTDDEVVVRNLVQRILSNEGFSILVAANGQEALRLSETCKIDLLLTDINMPGIDGFQLAERLRWLTPHLKVLFMSGHLPDTIPATAFLAKPFIARTLLRCVRDTLAELLPPGAGTLGAEKEKPSC
jgi:two-component system cell cycle sensor histidine kinase/response regulator CckA